MLMTRVVHVEDHIPGAVYIGAAVPERGLPASPWANPYTVGRDGDRAQVLRLYRAHLHDLVTFQPELLEALWRLHARPLACWCRHDGEPRNEGNACHGDELIAFMYGRAGL